jgi:regulator of cell morphogenesis and NO signaling
MTPYENQTVGNIAAANPASLRVFEKFGIDYCCGGKLPLQVACERANVEMEKVLAMIQEQEQSRSKQAERQWTGASASELIAHIVDKHHAFVRNEIPRLEALLVKVNGRHGSSHKELAEIQDLFVAVAQELQGHMMREEQVLFPYIDKLDGAVGRQEPAPAACFGSVTFPIARMLADHDDAGGLLASIRGLANGYVLPEGACQSFAALYRGLEEFEQDLHRHIHLENNILFPRAIELERNVGEPCHAVR